MPSSGLEMRSAALPMYSSVTGDRVGPNAIDAAYWWRNVREPVNFEAAIRAMLDAGVNTFVEIGPRAVLTAYLTEIIKPLGAGALVLPSLTRKEDGGERLSTLATQLELSGGLRDRARLFPVPGRYVDLPHYPWQRERHWHSSTSESQGRLARRVLHPLLGFALEGEALHWENHAGPGDAAALCRSRGRRRRGAAGLGFRRDGARRRPRTPAPGTARAGCAAGDRGAGNCRAVAARIGALQNRASTHRPRAMADSPSSAANVCAKIPGAPMRPDGWSRIACRATHAPLETPTRDPDVSAETHYAFARAVGLHYGPAFRSVASVWYRREGILGAIATPPEIAAETASALLHPAYLDGAFQLLADLALRDQKDKPAHRAELPAFLPVRIDRLELLQPHARVAFALAAPANAGRHSRRSMRADFSLYDAFEAPIAIARGVRFRAVAIHAGTAHRARWITARAVPMPRRDPHCAVPLPALGELARHCAARLHTPSGWPRGGASRKSSSRCSTHCARPLPPADCANSPAINPSSRGALIESGRIAASSAPMLRNLLQLLTEDGVVQPIANQWLWRTDVTLPKPEDIWMSLITDYPEYALAHRARGCRRTASCRTAARGHARGRREGRPPG